MSEVIWHDLESGGYGVDLPVWRELAQSPVLDVGCGTGRVALDLAAAGFDVVAVDVVSAFVDELRERARRAGVAVEAIVADARTLDLERDFESILVPQSSLQLIPERADALAALSRHLRPGGTFAVAITEDCAPYEGIIAEPDRVEVGGRRYESQPVALRDRGSALQIERIRWIIEPDGERTADADITVIEKLTVDALTEELTPLGLRLERSFSLADTEHYVGATVAVYRS